MGKPNIKTEFKSISELINYSDKEKYFCSAVVFSPETENEHFKGCPPYIRIETTEYSEDGIFFEVPAIVAYFAKTHPCYTMQGKENDRREGERILQMKLRTLLGIKER